MTATRRPKKAWIWWDSRTRRNRVPENSWPKELVQCLAREQKYFSKPLELIEGVRLRDGTVVFEYEVAYVSSRGIDRRLAVYRNGRADQCSTSIVLEQDEEED